MNVVLRILAGCLIINSFLIVSFVLPSSLCVAAQDKPAPTKVDGNIKWVFNYEEGLTLSKESGKPLFLVFRCER